MKINVKKMLKSISILSVLVAVIMSMAFAITVPEPINPNVNQGIIDAVGTVLGAAQWIGIVVGTGMIIYIGVKYLTAGAGKKAEAKETAIPLLIGAGLVMLAPTIASWVFGLFSSGS